MRTKESDLYEKMLAARRFEVQGTLEYADLRHRYLRLRSDENMIRVQCIPGGYQADCIDYKVVENKTPVVVSYFKYHTGYMITSIRTISGINLLSEIKQEKHFLSYSKLVEKDTYLGKFIFGIFIGELIASIRYLRIRRQRNQCTSAVADNQP
jgi:hypothetical protein